MEIPESLWNPIPSEKDNDCFNNTLYKALEFADLKLQIESSDYK